MAEFKKKVGEVQANKQRDDIILNKQVEEIKKLKSHIKRLENGTGSIIMNSNYA